MTKNNEATLKLIIKIENERISKLIWGLLNIFILWIFIIPLFFGIFQLIKYFQLSKELRIIKISNEIE